MSEAEDNWLTIPGLLKSSSLTISGAHFLYPSVDRQSTSSNTAIYDGLGASPYVYSPMLMPDLKADPASVRGISLVSGHETPSNGLGSVGGRSYDRLRTVSLRHVYSYADVIKDVAFEAASRPPWTFILAPLRGGIVPARLVQILLGGHLPIEPFPFTNHDSPGNRIVYQRELDRILLGRAEDRDRLRFGVIDTAQGGYGTKALVQMLQASSPNLHGKQLVIDFCILHWRKHHQSAEARINDAIEDGRDRLVLWHRRWDVDNLIVEDWDAVMGASDTRKSSRKTAGRMPGAGGFLLIGDNGVKQVYSSNLPLTLMAMLVEIVSDTVRTDPRVRFVRDVLNERLTS